MKVGIIGLGSIGRKHAAILHRLGISDIFALRSNKGTLQQLPVELSFVQETTSLQDFRDTGLNGIVICTPTSLHIPNLLDSLSLKIPILIEKPLSDSFKALVPLEGQITDRIRVAYCLRFHPVFKEIKKILTENELGRVLKAVITVGQYLPHWHPYADYREEYYSLKKMGGGALRTLSHELDILQYLIGNYNALSASVKKISSLEIDTDDNVFIIGQHADRIESFLEIDFLAPRPRRRGCILCEKGEIVYDLIEPSLKIIPYQGEPNNRAIKKEDMYVNQAMDFINLMEGKEDMASAYDEAKQVMLVIERVEEASAKKNWIRV